MSEANDLDPCEPDAEAPSEAFDVERVPGGLKAGLEAVLMVIDEPVSAAELAAAVNLPVPEVTEALHVLQREYDGYTSTGSEPDPEAVRGFQLRNVAGGWRIYSRQNFAPLVAKYVLEGQTARLSTAALETLAVVAYRQPVSRARISAIRGVNVDSVVRTLTTRGLISELSTDPESGALLYGTTGYFLERLGLGSLDELPNIAPLLPGLDNLEEFDTTG